MTLTFPQGQRRVCTTIRLRNDRTQENTERFSLSLELPSNTDPRIELTQAEGQVIIRDSDEVVVELERESYTVDEDDGTVEVCVRITDPTSGCPVSYNISLVAALINGGAVASTDYEGAIRILDFVRCTRRRCFEVAILDDNQLESSESFTVSLVRGGLDEDIRLGRQQATVEIRDSDMVNVGFKQTQYRVEETDFEVSVCAKVKDNSNCIIPFPFNITFTSFNDTATSPDDYQAITAACTSPSTITSKWRGRRHSEWNSVDQATWTVGYTSYPD
jgi:hypothetical protein